MTDLPLESSHGFASDLSAVVIPATPADEPEHHPDSTRVRDALVRHGYDPDAQPRGVAGPPSFRYVTSDGIVLRNRVCELDGVLVDGHEGSDLDPGSTACIHCDYEGPNP